MVHGGVPGGGGDAAEEVSGARVPRPPEVHRQLLEGDQLRGEGGAAGEAAEGLHRARPYRPSRRHGQGPAPRATRRSSASAAPVLDPGTVVPPSPASMAHAPAVFELVRPALSGDWRPGSVAT